MIYTRNRRELDALTTHPRTVGLTGGIASGKTVAADALVSAGFYVVDADVISRELTAHGTPLEAELMAAFPNAVKDGALDRRALRAVIAADAAERARLDALTHPHIIAEIKRIVTARNGAFTVLAAPLLFESGLAAMCDATVCVTCPRRIRIERLTARDNVTAADAERMIDAQIHDTARATLSDYCVPSDVPLSDFTAEILELFTILKGA